MEKRRLLIVEDEQNFGAVLKSYLELNEFIVDWAEDGNVGLSYAKKNTYDLFIFDVMMPYKDGFTLAEQVMKIKPTIPFIFLTAKAMKEDQLKGFKLGADDYIHKPFDSELLLYKIKAILNRVGEPKKLVKLYEIGNYRFDLKRRSLVLGEEKIRLSPKESGLLGLLSEHKNDILSRDKALFEIWGTNDYFTKRSMDVYIAKLRKHLIKDSRVKIENIHGEGYSLIIE